MTEFGSHESASAAGPGAEPAIVPPPRLWPGAVFWLALGAVYVAVELSGLAGDLLLPVPLMTALVLARVVDVKLTSPTARQLVAVLVAAGCFGVAGLVSSRGLVVVDIEPGLRIVVLIAVGALTLAGLLRPVRVVRRGVGRRGLLSIQRSRVQVPSSPPTVKRGVGDDPAFSVSRDHHLQTAHLEWSEMGAVEREQGGLASGDNAGGDHRVVDPAAGDAACRRLPQQTPVRACAQGDDAPSPHEARIEHGDGVGRRQAMRWEQPSQDGVRFDERRGGDDHRLGAAQPALDRLARRHVMLVPSAHRGDHAAGIGRESGHASAAPTLVTQ